MEHLSDERMKALSQGDAATVAHFREHLKERCESCEQYLETHGGALLLDGLADRLLLETADLPPDEKNYDALSRRLRPASRTGQLLSAMAGVAACLLIVAGLSRIPMKGPSSDGEKGAFATGLELKVAQKLPNGAINRVDVGAVIPPKGALLFRYHSPEAVKARLYRQRAQDPVPEVLGEVPLEAGTHDLSVNQTVVGVDLSEERGKTTFILETLPERGQPTRSSVSVDVEARE